MPPLIIQYIPYANMNIRSQQQHKQRPWLAIILLSIIVVASLTAILQDSKSQRRRLSSLLTSSDDSLTALHEDSNWIDYDTAAALALAATSITTSSESESEEVGAIITSFASRQAIQPYTIQDALYESDMFEYTFCILVYDQSRDKFITLYSKDHEWKSGNSKMWKGE